MKVSVSVHGRWHGFDLANGLFARGRFGQLSTTYPSLIARRFVPAEMPLITAPLLEIRRRIYDRFRIGQKPDLAIASAFGKFAAAHLDDISDILVGWSSATLEAFEPARSMGKKIVIERGSSHISHQQDVLREAYAEFGLTFSGTESGIVEREIEEYRMADAIAVPTRFAAETFIKMGADPLKLIVNGYGVDLSRFSPVLSRTEVQKPKIIFVGSVGIRKGVPWLLDAFKPLATMAELHVVGPAEVGMDSIMAKHRPTSNVTFHGSVASNNISNLLQSADIFCLPSLEEGFPLSLLQAMATGLPVVTTKEAGAEDIVSNGVEGRIVPARNIETLTAVLAELINDSDRRVAMGEAARKRVEKGNSWDDYVDRALAGYEKLLA